MRKIRIILEKILWETSSRDFVLECALGSRWLLLNRGRASCDTSFKVFLSPTQLDGLAFSKLSKLGIYLLVSSSKDHRGRWVASRRENLVQNDVRDAPTSALWQSTVCLLCSRTTGPILINCSPRHTRAYLREFRQKVRILIPHCFFLIFGIFVL